MMIRQLLAVVFVVIPVLMAMGCSSPAIRMEGPRTLPESVVRFMRAKDHSGVDFEILSYNAATDLMNLGKQALEGQDSGAALKYLSLGAELLPYRSDLVYLRNKALKAYVEVTNSMVGLRSIPCSTLQERHAFLKMIAPDALTEVKAGRADCKVLAGPQAKPFDFKRIATSTLPGTNRAAEKKAYSDLSSDLRYFLEKDRSFPFESLLVYALKEMGELEWEVTELKIDPQTRSESEVAVTGKIEQRWLPGVEGSSKFSSEEHCEGVKELLDFPQGAIEMRCEFRGWRSNRSEYRSIRSGREAAWGLMELFRGGFLPNLQFFRLVMAYHDGRSRDFAYYVFWDGGVEPSLWFSLLNEGPSRMLSELAFRKASCLPAMSDREVTQAFYGHETGWRNIKSRVDACRPFDLSNQKFPERFKRPELTAWFPRLSLANNARVVSLAISGLTAKDVDGLKSVSLVLDRQGTYDFYRKQWDMFKSHRTAR